jgi:hypothetical protein
MDIAARGVAPVGSVGTDLHPDESYRPAHQALMACCTMQKSPGARVVHLCFADCACSSQSGHANLGSWRADGNSGDRGLQRKLPGRGVLARHGV